MESELELDEASGEVKDVALKEEGIGRDVGL